MISIIRTARDLIEMVGFLEFYSMSMQEVLGLKVAEPHFLVGMGLIVGVKGCQVFD